MSKAYVRLNYSLIVIWCYLIFSFKVIGRVCGKKAVRNIFAVTLHHRHYSAAVALFTKLPVFLIEKNIIFTYNRVKHAISPFPQA